MANVGAPPVREFKEVPSDIYEAVTAPYSKGMTPADNKPAGEIPNTFYDPDTDPESKATQFRWTFYIREDTELHGIPLSMYTGSSIGRHPRNKLTNLVKTLDPSFDIDVAYTSESEFLQRNALRPIRLVVESITKGEGKDKKTYAKVTGILPSKMGELTEVEKLLFASSEVKNTDPLA